MLDIEKNDGPENITLCRISGMSQAAKEVVKSNWSSWSDDFFFSADNKLVLIYSTGSRNLNSDFLWRSGQITQQVAPYLS